jgi:bifunctional DNA-binding transcriptional regulator/antitoxin component of YhaV-PrlF toxin-antitoxin module
MIILQRLLLCASAVMLSSVGWADELSPLKKAGQPTYVRFAADYVPVGCRDELGFKEGDVVMVRKISDANYIYVAKTPSHLWFDKTIPTPEQIKEEWIKFPGSRERVRRDKVEVVSEEEAITFALSKKIKDVASSNVVDRMLDEQAAEEESRKQTEFYPETISAGRDESGRRVTGKYRGDGRYFCGRDENGNPIIRRASTRGDGRFYLGRDKNDQPIIGR